MNRLTASALAFALTMTVAAPAFAENDDGSSSSSTTTSSPSSSSTSEKMMKKDAKMMKGSMSVDGACVSTAVDKRDTALITAFSAFTSSVNAALSTRKDALKAAWALTDTAQRNAAVKAAWSAYGTAAKTARNTFKNAKRNAWKAFKTDAKTCKLPSADASGESTDNQL